MREQTCFFTGHRNVPEEEMQSIYDKTYLLCASLVEKMNMRTFVCGGARGFDTLAAQAVLKLKKHHPDIRLHLVLPCRNQASRWSAAAKQAYCEVLDAADAAEYVSESYTSYCMHARNRRMVDMSSCGIVFMRHASGGTAYTVKYAIAQDVKLYSVDRVAEKEKSDN